MLSGPKYSICMLCFNDSKTLRKSISSLSDFRKTGVAEIIVIDNLSVDGSGAILSEFQREGVIKLINQKCARGRGRQIALENSVGKYVIAHLDCDDVFRSEGLAYLLRLYHQNYEGLVMMTKRTDTNEASNVTVAPREVLLSLGGWRDINFGEDWDLWARADALGKYSFMNYPYVNPPHESINVRTERVRLTAKRFTSRYEKYRDAYRTGRPLFGPDERVSASQRFLAFLSTAAVVLKRSKLTPIANPDFGETKGKP